MSITLPEAGCPGLVSETWDSKNLNQPPLSIKAF